MSEKAGMMPALKSIARKRAAARRAAPQNAVNMPAAGKIPSYRIHRRMDSRARSATSQLVIAWPSAIAAQILYQSRLYGTSEFLLSF